MSKEKDKDKDDIKQPKFSKRKEQQTEKGDGLEEYARDNPNFTLAQCAHFAGATALRLSV